MQIDGRNDVNCSVDNYRDMRDEVSKIEIEDAAKQAVGGEDTDHGRDKTTPPDDPRVPRHTPACILRLRTRPQDVTAF